MRGDAGHVDKEFVPNQKLEDALVVHYQMVGEGTLPLVGSLRRPCGPTRAFLGCRAHLAKAWFSPWLVSTSPAGLSPFLGTTEELTRLVISAGSTKRQGSKNLQVT